MAILFTIKLKPAKKWVHFAPKTKVEKSAKAYSRKQKHKSKED